MHTQRHKHVAARVGSVVILVSTKEGHDQAAKTQCAKQVIVHAYASQAAPL